MADNGSAAAPPVAAQTPAPEGQEGVQLQRKGEDAGVVGKVESALKPVGLLAKTVTSKFAGVEKSINDLSQKIGADNLQKKVGDSTAETEAGLNANPTMQKVNAATTGKLHEKTGNQL